LGENFGSYSDLASMFLVKISKTTYISFLTIIETPVKQLESIDLNIYNSQCKNIFKTPSKSTLEEIYIEYYE